MINPEKILYELFLIFQAIGGGQINQKSILTVLLLISLALLINVNHVSAANSTFNSTSISKSAVTVQNYVQTNHTVPNNVTVSNQKVSSAQYLYLETATVQNINNSNKNPVTLKNVSYPTNPSETLISGNLTKTEYISIANKITTFINTNGRLPNYVTTSLGTIRYENLIYTYSKILSFYQTNNRLPNTVTVKPWTTIHTTASSTTANRGFIVGYYIDPHLTPLSGIDFKALKALGITDVYVRASDTGSAGIIYTALTALKLKTDAAGLRLNAWVWYGFSHAKQVAAMGVGVLVDVETYSMANDISTLTQMRADTQGVPFTIAVKPDGWDGNQLYNLLAPICDYISPMLYIGDYHQSITGLTNWVQTYTKKYPGKILPSLETYVSDTNPTPKSNANLLSEINAVKPYTPGVILFRYGLSNY